MSRDKNRILYRQKFFALKRETYSSTFGQVERRGCPLQARLNGFCRHLERTHIVRDEGYLFQDRHIWKIISPDLLPQEAEDWVLMTPPYLNWCSRVRLLQRVTACVVVLISTACRGETRAAAKSSNVLVEPEQAERDSTSPKNEAE